MTFFNLTSTEIVLLVVLAVVVLGPRRLPHYAQALARLVRQVRDLAEGAKSQIKEEMGPAFDDVDWRQLDPRQYDPRRIVREALTEPSPPARRATGAAAAAVTAVGTSGASTEAVPAVPGVLRGGGSRSAPASYDPTRPTPFDVDAT
ncbi:MULTISPECIES: Sec-independent protein translocase TatB [unclassified Ornithinimicrobium]|uniref:Sec-independent protein translocase TatB n=1 Tax=unclassified Ornithinimicrobium TaxID=2615080 RepID=UPI0038535198